MNISEKAKSNLKAEKTRPPRSAYVLVFILLMISGSPVVDWKVQYVIFATFLLFKVKLHKEDKILYLFLGLSFFLFIAQYIVFGWNSFPAIINLSAKIFIAYAVVKILGESFRYVILNIMTSLCAAAIFFNTLSLITGIELDLFPWSGYTSCLVWGKDAISTLESYRNCGFVWEPGAFAGYILLVVILYFDKIDVLRKKYKGKLYILMIALLTTMSTTGYVVLLLLVICYLIRYVKHKVVLVLIAPILVVLIGFVASLDFMGNKITEQVEGAQDVDVFDEAIDHGRFSALVFDMYYIAKHPIIGNGLHSQTRYADHSYMSDEALWGFGNGFSKMLGSMGILFMLFYLGMIYKSRLSKFESLTVIMAVVLLLNGEDYLMFPLFYSIPFFFYQNRIPPKELHRVSI